MPTHRYVTARRVSGVVVHETFPAGYTDLPYFVVVTDGGRLETLCSGAEALVEDRPGPCPYSVVEHDPSKSQRITWLTWTGSTRESPLYLDIHGPEGYHAQLLWERTVWSSFVCLQDGLGVDYIPSAFGGFTTREHPHSWELVIEEVDPTRPPGRHRLRGGFHGHDGAMAAWHAFWSETSGDWRRTTVLVQIWSPIGRERPYRWVLLRRPASKDVTRLSGRPVRSLAVEVTFPTSGGA